MTTRNIKEVNLNFQPDEAFKADLQHATFAWVDKLAEGRNTAAEASDSGKASGSSQAGSDGDQNENPLG